MQKNRAIYESNEKKWINIGKDDVHQMKSKWNNYVCCVRVCVCRALHINLLGSSYRRWRQSGILDLCQIKMDFRAFDFKWFFSLFSPFLLSLSVLSKVYV